MKHIVKFHFVGSHCFFRSESANSSITIIDLTQRETINFPNTFISQTYCIVSDTYNHFEVQRGDENSRTRRGCIMLKSRHCSIARALYLVESRRWITDHLPVRVSPSIYQASASNVSLIQQPSQQLVLLIDWTAQFLA